MDLDPGHEARHLRHETREPTALRAPARVRDPMQHERVQPRITREHFPCAAGGGIALADRGDVFAKSRKHGWDCVVLGEKKNRLRERVRALSARAGLCISRHA
ncbi:hypothetical protein QFZ98_006256 [Paraburkholderia youngii]